MARENKNKGITYNRKDFTSFWWRTRHSEYSAPVVKKFVGDFFDVLKDFLVKLDDGDTLRLMGLGTFKVVRRDAHTCNIGGKTYDVPTRKVLKFSLDRGLSESVRGDIEIEYDDEEMDSF